MKPFFLLFLFFASPAYSFLLLSTGVVTTVEYDEPETSISTAGIESPLKDLKETTIFYTVGQGTITAMVVPSSRLIGGGHIIKDIFVPILYGEEKTISVWATATSTHNMTSEKSNVDSYLVDRLSPSSSTAHGIITGNEFEITYYEPTLSADESVLTDLLRTEIYYEAGGDPSKIAEIPASRPEGGGLITKRIIIPLTEDTESHVSIWVIAVDTAQNMSLPGISVKKRLDRLSPAPPPF